MHSISLSILPALLVSLRPVMAQAQYSILEYSSSALPECAKGCVTLTNAAGSCLPPAAPVTQVEIYKSCFCQSALLTQLYSSPNGVCDTACTNPTDLTQLRNWYVSWCQGSALPKSAGGASSTSAGATNTRATATATPTRPVSTGPPPSWISGHWRYVILIVILILLIGGGAAFAVWFKKRRRAQAAAAAQETNAPVVWGPFQAQNHTDGFNYVDSYEEMPVPPPPISEKGRSRRGTGFSSVREPPQSADSLVPPDQSRWSDSSAKWWKRGR